ncbi:MAG: nucleotidyltransferase domain-containing protein [Candidatus Margulisiibacteriota bacterium]|jgi:predicted nucleotidyltransferase
MIKRKLTINNLKKKIERAIPDQKNVSVYLFGSYARKGQSAESDVDLMVLADKENSARIIVRELYKKLSDVEIDYDILSCATSSFRKRSDTNDLYRNILKEGIVLYGKGL